MCWSFYPRRIWPKCVQAQVLGNRIEEVAYQKYVLGTYISISEKSKSLLAALSWSFCLKNTWTLCSDSSAITGTRKDQIGSRSPFWSDPYSRTWIYMGSAATALIECTLMGCSTCRKMLDLIGGLNKITKSSLPSPSDSKIKSVKGVVASEIIYFGHRWQLHPSWLLSRGSSLPMERRPGKSSRATAWMEMG